MMFTSFQEIEAHILDSNFRATVALAAAHDDDALRSVVNARRQGIIDAVLIGDGEKIEALLAEFKEDSEDYTIIDRPDSASAAALACEMVSSGKADMIMKGLLPTATFLHAVLDKQYGFVPSGGLISVANVYESARHGKLIVFTDCAINICPSYEEKVKILKNAVRLSRQLNVECPKVAVVAPVEVVNPVMPSTVDAAMLSKAAERGQIKNCIVDGPLGLDNAVSKEAAAHKGIRSEVAGDPDILLFPDLASANIFSKAVVYFGDGSPSSGVAVGCQSPVVMTSRSDTAVNKYNSILIGALQSLQRHI